MSLTVAELNAGIAYWRTKRWPQDFHNAFYQQMATTNPNGIFTPVWWRGFLPILRGWKALRPRSQAFVTNRATGRFTQLSQDWNSAIAPVLTSDIATIRWSQISSFPAAVAQIKNVTSPVFTSKFCHFLAPHIFPVIDNAAMGKPFSNYQDYYLYGQGEWAATSAPVQINLINTLTQAIGTPPIQSYPMKCKIIELCLIGRYQRGANNAPLITPAPPSVQPAVAPPPSAARQPAAGSPQERAKRVQRRSGRLPRVDSPPGA